MGPMGAQGGPRGPGAQAPCILSDVSYGRGLTVLGNMGGFREALNKDAAFYDEQNPNEMTSKINKEAGAV